MRRRAEWWNVCVCVCITRKVLLSNTQNSLCSFQHLWSCAQWQEFLDWWLQPFAGTGMNLIVPFFIYCFSIIIRIIIFVFETRETLPMLGNFLYSLFFPLLRVDWAADLMIYESGKREQCVIHIFCCCCISLKTSMIHLQASERSTFGSKDGIHSNSGEPVPIPSTQCSTLALQNGIC